MPATRRPSTTDPAGGTVEPPVQGPEEAAVEHGQHSGMWMPGEPPTWGRMFLPHLDPWSVMKTSFLLSVAFGVVTFVAIFMVWSVLGAAGVWESINSAVASIVEGDSGNSTFDVTDYVGMSRVLGFTLLVSVVDVILITAIATLTAFLYNLAAALLGGIEVTLAEDEK